IFQLKQPLILTEVYMFQTLRKVFFFLVLSALIFGLAAQHTAQAQDKPKGEITVWAWKPVWDGITAAKLLDGFAAKYPDIKVNQVVYGTGDVYQKLQVAFSAGTGAPDVVLLEDSHIGQFVDLGGLSDMTSLVKPYTDKIVPYKFEQITKDSKV